MLEMIYWCFLKYTIDPTSRLGIGGIEYKIGGFIDRFSNTCVNWLIFRHILKNKNYIVDSDYFIYKEKSAKKSPDILGIKNKNGQVVPFCKFNDTKWEMVNEEMPFIEIKALRKTQNLGALGEPQFATKHFFCYVETDFDEHYLLNFFENKIYEFSKAMKMSDSYITNNSQNVIITPPSLSPPTKIGTIKLLGIYKGDEIKKQFSAWGEGEKPYYLSSVEILDESSLKKNAVFSKVDVIDGKYEHKLSSTSSHIPFYINQNSFYVSNQKKILTKLVIKVERDTYINNFLIPPGFATLIFKKFDRSKKETEYINHKFIIDQKNGIGHKGLRDSTDELIDIMDKISENY
jgi:hypothetical protein